MALNFPILLEPKLVDIGDIEIAYKEFGEGTPLVLIMGYSACMEMWPFELLRLLSQNFRVIIFDNRGMGNSSTSDEEYSIKLFADDTAKLMNILEIENAHVLGFSMGAMVALELALSFPEKIKKLVLCSGHCGGSESVYPDEEVFEKFFDIECNNNERVNRLYNLLFPKKWIKEHRNRDEYFPIPKAYTAPCCVEQQFKAMRSWDGVYNELSRIESPALVVAGSEDEITPPENSKILAREMKKAHVIQMEGGHGLMWQYPRKFFNLLRTFLD